MRASFRWTCLILLLSIVVFHIAGILLVASWLSFDPDGWQRLSRSWELVVALATATSFLSILLFFYLLQEKKRLMTWASGRSRPGEAATPLPLPPCRACRSLVSSRP